MKLELPASMKSFSIELALDNAATTRQTECTGETRAVAATIAAAAAHASLCIHR